MIVPLFQNATHPFLQLWHSGHLYWINWLEEWIMEYAFSSEHNILNIMALNQNKGKYQILLSNCTLQSTNNA